MSTEYMTSCTQSILQRREFTSAVRTTFSIDPEGEIARVWDNVKSTGHAEKVLSELKILKEKWNEWKN